MSQRKGWVWPSLCAHRGAGKLAPENTLAALKKGRELGVGMVEVDVKLSKDVVAFLMHDDRLERCSSGRGRACRREWARLRELDAGLWHSPSYRGERIPSLEEAAAFLIQEAMAVNLEIKPCPGRDEETGRVVAQRAAELWTGAGGPPPLLSSFSRASLASAKAAAPELPLGLLCGALRPGDLNFAIELGAVAIHLDGNRSGLADALAVKAAGLGLAYYTINEPDIARKLLGWGADCLITDRVEAIAKLMGQPASR